MEPSLSSSELKAARLENVERLASFLGVTPPRRTPNAVVYKQRLVAAVMTQLRRQAERDHFERLARR